MFRGLVQKRTQGRAGKVLAELAVGLFAALLGVAARAVLVPLTGPIAPFVLNFVAAAVATLFAGWRAGTVAVLGGQLLTWLFIIDPNMSFHVTDSREAAAFALATVAQLCLVGIIGRYQHEVDVARAEANREHELRGLLLFELKHRLKNTLALAQSLAQQTFRGQGVDESIQAYHRRLDALAQTHDLLTQCEWTGADIRQVIEQAVEALVSDRQRANLEGPSVILEPKACLSLALVFHELATNSVKYGAFSNGSGRLAVSWANEPLSGFLLEWIETGGPPARKPSRRGFGTKLIERAMASELDAKVRLNFRETGFSCVVTAPYISAPNSDAALDTGPDGGTAAGCTAVDRLASVRLRAKLTQEAGSAA
jgi:two-component sensor histidine kinase